MLAKDVTIEVGQEKLRGILTIPKDAKAIVLFAHGSGSGRLSPRNQFVAKKLQEKGLATLMMDLLTVEEEEIDEKTRQFRFDIGLLAERLKGCAEWVLHQNEMSGFVLGYFGASTGAAAALMAASEQSDIIKAVVSRGGRPDLAIDQLADVFAPTLLIVGGEDLAVIELNKKALEALHCPKKLQIVPGATHLFEEPGTLEAVADLASNWFVTYLVSNS